VNCFFIEGNKYVFDMAADIFIKNMKMLFSLQIFDSGVVVVVVFPPSFC
jgi:hypothetical protein